MDNRNYILAIVLSLGILVAWQYLYVGPQMEAERQRLEAQQAAQVIDPTTGSAVQVDESAPGEAPPELPGTVTPMDRQAVLASSERITIETSHITGSISTQGGRIDDIHLEEYRETQEDDSDTVVLFSPSGSADPFYAEFGWAQGGGGSATLPTASTIWSVEGNQTLTPSSPVTLLYDNGEGLIFRRTIALDDDYMFTVRQEVENTSEAGVLLYPYGLVARHGEPRTSRLFILHEGLIGWFGQDDGLAEVDYDDLRDDGPIQYRNVEEGWLGITDKYWAATLIPSGLEAYRGEFRVDQIATGESFVASYLGGGFEIAPGSTVAIENNLFAGAKEVAIVDGYEAALGVERFELLIDWGWFYFLTKPMFHAIKWLFGIFGNFGVAILLITVAIKLVFLPLANKSYASMSKMKKVQPQLKEIQERYKEDKPELQKQMMALYQKEKINPVAGCWPVLIQIPVFFALYKVLFVTIEMRHAPFFGWVQDLSAPDPTSIFNLFGLLPYDPTLVPLIGPLLGLGVWPILMGLTMFVQMKLNPQPTDPTQAAIFTWMPIVFTFMLATFPAGLVIYWTWNNFLSIIQQAAIMKRHGVKIELMDNLRAMFGKKDKDANQPAE
ncbi:MAG: membrane protein insertase YidC [Pseudomonadota bacterium]